MENITTLKDGKKLTKQLTSYVSDITIAQVLAWIVCFIYSRANFFGVIKPFATAFYVAAGFSGISKVIAIISITIGNAIFSNFYETARQTLALLLFEAFSHIVYISGKRKETPLNRAVLIAVLIAITGLLRGLVQGLRVYDLVVSILCAGFVFSLSVIMEPSAEFLQKTNKKTYFNGRMILSRTAMLCGFVISLKGVVIWNCELGTVLAGIAVLVIALRKGSSEGACAGALIGMVIALYDIPSSLEIPGMMALAGAVSGLPVRTKTASASLWTLVVIFFSGLSVLSGELIEVYYEALASGILFLLIPNSVINFFGDGLAGLQRNTQVSGANESAQIHEAADKLFVLSKALSRVSRNIEETLSEDNETENSAAEWISEIVAEKVCNRCSFCERCWKILLIKMYKLIEKTISELKTDETGHLEIPAWFKATCPKHDKFFETLGLAYSLYKTENMWKMKINDSRLMLAKQASLVSGTILAAARGLLDTSGRNYELENMLLNTAVNSGIPVTNFRYNCRQESKPYVEAVFKEKEKLNAEELDEMVRETLQANFIRVGESRRDMMGYSIVRYMKQPKYKTATGIARASRANSGFSGDNFAFFISNDGYHISAISDGFGTGRRAEWYSRTAIQMLENFLDDGIELGHAIRFLNLYLDLRGENERLATMDICAIDLSKGDTSFYKYDAPPSFIKGQQGVLIINNNDNEIEDAAASHYKPSKMEAGDFVVMVSDGVLEAFSEGGEASGLQWFIESIDTINSQYLADAILQEAITRSNGNHDDLTVLVTRLW